MLYTKVHTNHPGELPAIKQHLDWTLVSGAFSGAYCGVFGRTIRPGPLAILLAQSALETGRWKQGCYNFNFSNIKCSQAYAEKAGNYHQYYRLNELLKQPDGSYKYEWFDPTHPQTRMRAYLTAPAGAAEKIRFLGTASNPAKGNRYQKAWDALEADDPRSYSHELRAAGYYTAKEAPYTAGIVSLYNEFRAKIDAQPPANAIVASPPLVAEEYDDDTPEHSAASQQDLAAAWIGEPRLGLPEDVYQDLQRLKQEDYSDD